MVKRTSIKHPTNNNSLYVGLKFQRDTERSHELKKLFDDNCFSLHAHFSLEISKFPDKLLTRVGF